MKKHFLRDFIIFITAILAITTVLSCHPDSVHDFIDYDGDYDEYEQPKDWSYPSNEPKRLWNGNGTQESPYSIRSAQDLANLSYMVNNGKMYSNEYFRLDSDIDLNTSADYFYHKEWMPIGNNRNEFGGIFDGNHHSINGLYINSSEYEHAGLFGFVYNATIKNLTLRKGSVSNSYSDSSATGAIVGCLYYSTMISCGNDDTTVSDSNVNSKAGGLIGYCDYSTISNSYCRAPVNGYTFSKSGSAGGIAGDIYRGEIHNCYFSGEVSAYTACAITNESNSYGNSKVSFCYYSSSCGAGAAENKWGNGQASFSSAYSPIYTTPDDKGDTLLKRLNMWIRAQTSALKYCTWIQDNSSGYPTFSNSLGTSAEYAWEYPSSLPTVTWTGSGSFYSPIKITTAQELADFAYLVNNGSDYEDKYIELGADITLNPETMYLRIWTPIGNSSSRPFKGNFNGNNHTIKGLYIHSSDNNYKGGLFGYISEGTVNNLTIGYGDVYNSYDSRYSSSRLGSIAGYIEDETNLSNCKNNGTKVHSQSGYSGGLVGEMSGSEIVNSSNSASVSSTNGTAGGIAGSASNDSTCSHCSNYGSISGSTFGEIVGNK